MKNNLYIKVVLLSAITVLLMYCIVPTVLPSYHSHATTRIQYKVIFADELSMMQTPGDFEAILNQYGNEGWELSYYFPDMILIFIKK